MSIRAASFMKLFLWACLTKRRPEDEVALVTYSKTDKSSHSTLPLPWMPSHSHSLRSKRGGTATLLFPGIFQAPTMSPQDHYPTWSEIENT